MSNVRAEIYARQYRKTLDATAKTAAAVPLEKQFKQAAAGKAHPLWLLGHLAMSFDLLTNNWLLGVDLKIPAKWTRIFGPTEFGGNPITTNPGDYPSWEETLAAYKTAGETAVEAVGNLNDEQLKGYGLGPIPDQFKETFGILDLAIPANATHDTHHRGQMTVLVTLP